MTGKHVPQHARALEKAEWRSLPARNVPDKSALIPPLIHTAADLATMETEHDDDNRNMAVGTPLQEYQAFIDGLLEWPRHSVVARRVSEWENRPPESTYVTPPDFDVKMRQFTHEQRQIMAELLQQEHEAGIHAFLAYLTDKINLEGLRIYRNGVPLAIEPYGSEMYYDWVCRCHESSWPEPEAEQQPYA